MNKERNEKKKGSHVEFQIIYADILLSRRENVTLHSKVWTVHSDFFPKNTVWKGGGKKNNFTEEKHDKHYLSE